MTRRVFTIVAVKAWAQLLGDRIERMPEFEVVGSAPDGAVALDELRRLDPPAGIIVIDVDTRLALETASVVLRSDATGQLIAVGLDEDPADAVAWAMAGAVGLVDRTASLDELLNTLAEVARGEPHCSAGIAGALLRGISSANDGSRRNAMPLTGRELEVARLVASGLTNKEIATRLQIAPGTVKSHVHSVIRKLSVARRAHVASKLPQGNLLSMFAAQPNGPAGIGASTGASQAIGVPVTSFLQRSANILLNSHGGPEPS
jgi:DNA-binding NarL/FixJ family response regulator